jgi:hypothetical protein
LHFHNWLEAHILRREAEALIQPAEDRWHGSQPASRYRASYQPRSAVESPKSLKQLAQQDRPSSSEKGLGLHAFTSIRSVRQTMLG